MAMAMDTAMDMATVTETMSVRSILGQMRHQGKYIEKRRPTRILADALLFGAIFVCNLAGAGDWDYSDSISIGVSAVDRTGSGAYSGQIYQVSPKFRLAGRGGRSSADINYRLVMSLGTGDTDPRPLAHNLIARGEVEAIEDFFYLGASAGARLSGNSSSTGPVDAINFNEDDGRQSFSFGVQPRFVAPLNPYVTLYSNNSINFVTYTEDSATTDGDSTSTRWHIGARNDRSVGPLDWFGDLSHRTTSFETRDDTRKKAEVGLWYRLDEQWRLRGSVGYEDNDVQTNRSNTSGTIWDIGTLWTPNPRTSVDATFGSRYFGNRYSVSARHRSRRTRLTLGLSRDVDNRRTQSLIDESLYLFDEDGFIVLDPVTGDPIVASIPQVDSTDEDFVNTRLRGILNLIGQRTSAVVTGEVSNREYEESSITEDSYILSLDASRRLGSKYTATLGAGFDHTTYDDDTPDSDIYSFRVSLGRRLARRTNVSLYLLHRGRTSGDDYNENRIGIILTSNFLTR